MLFRSSQAEVDFILATGTTDYRLEKNEDSHKLDVITENYQIGTDLRSGDLCYADDSCFIIMVSDDYNSKIHYYDVEKREHYILDTTEYGSNIVHCGDGVILSEASYDFSAYSAVYYVIPHRACAEDALSDFSSDCIEIPQAYYRMSRDFCAR